MQENRSSGFLTMSDANQPVHSQKKAQEAGNFGYIKVRAFSDLFGKFLVPMKLGKNCVIWGKNTI